jgi:hypothetical protein
MIETITFVTAVLGGVVALSAIIKSVRQAARKRRRASQQERTELSESPNPVLVRWDRLMA